MNKILNKENITKIVMRPKAITKCQIGQDWFNNDLEIEFIPNECYPDYMQIERYVLTEIEGQELNIEHVVDKLYGMIKKTFNPLYLKVTDHIRGCNTHFDVDVIKE